MRQNPPVTLADATPDTGPAKRVFVRSYGCQMNVYDSDRITEMMAAEGYASVDRPEEADLIVLNTCHIREKAAEKVYSELGRIKALKAERQAAGRETVVAVAGCVAQAEGAEIRRRAPVVDLVVGPQSYQKLPALLRDRPDDPVAVAFAAEEKFAAIARGRARHARVAHSAFLTIQEGCDKFCSFCVVPYTRGAELSRPVAAILDEAKALVERGAVEITLLGQNVNAYHGEGPGGVWSLARLLERLATIPGLRRLRYTTSHPRDMTDDLLQAHRDLPALMPYLHLPVQAGSDRILKAMNRRHTASDYRAIVDRLRALRPDIALSTDIIVGFPGETEADFAATLALVDAVGFAASFSFKYSERPGTPAADRPDQVPEPVKAERLARLQERLDHHAAAFQAASIGRVVEVLVEKPGRHPGQVAGKSPHLQAVQCEGPASLIGKVVPMRLMAPGRHSLFGALVEPPVGPQEQAA